ncbi:hypothetical protein RB601_002468 [Gaeumannomyces tritici]
MSTSNGSEDALPPQRNTPSPSSRPTGSLQAAATVNAGLQHESSRGGSSQSAASPGGSMPRSMAAPHHNRRRSSVLMNLQLNDPNVPGPGEMITDSHNGAGHYAASPQPRSGSPRSPMVLGRDPLRQHGRAPSLGEIHQEFEAETEGHVNRLLQIISQQQLQLQQLQAQVSGGQSPAAGDEPSASPVAATSSGPSSAFPVLTPSSSLPRSPMQLRSSFDLARADLQQRRSRTPSRTASPRLRSTSISGESAAAPEPLGLAGRDESAFYQAETQTLTRENQMLRHRIRDLERQLTEMGATSPTAAVTHEPFQHSNLTRSTSISGEHNPATTSQKAE